MKACFATTLLIFTAELCNAQLQFRFQHFGVEDGLAKDPFMVVQDSLGFLWIQHETGLSRFDGYSFKYYRHDPNDSLSLPRNTSKGTVGRITASKLFLDPAGNLWILNQVNNDYILAKYDRKTDSFRKYRPALKGDAILASYFDKGSPILWLSISPYGLFGFDLESRKTHHYVNMGPDTLMDFSFGSPLEGRNSIQGISDQGSFLLLTTWDGLWKFDKTNHTFSRPTAPPAYSKLFNDSPFISLLEDPSNDGENLWLLNYLNDPSIAYYSFLKVSADLSEVRRYNLPNIGALGWAFCDGQGTLWLSTYENGLFKLDPNDGKLTNYQHVPDNENSLQTDKLHLVTVDRDGNIWVTSEMGLSKLQPQDMITYNFRSDAVTNPLTGVFQSNHKDYVVTVRYSRKDTFHHEIFIAPVVRGQLESLKLQRLNTDLIMGPTESVTAISKGKNHLWIGSSTGLASIPLHPEFDNMLSSPITIFGHEPDNPNTISSEHVSTILEDSTGFVWVGTTDAGLNKLNPSLPYGGAGSVTHFRHNSLMDSSLSDDVIPTALSANNNHSFWVPTSVGLDIMNNGTFQHVFNNKSVTAVRNMPGGTVLVGTMEGLYEGVIAGDKYEFSRLPLNLRVCALREDSHGRIWISDCDKLICYDRDNQLIMEFGGREGIDHIGNQIHETSEGVMIVSDARGISFFDPLSLQIDSAHTVPVFTSITVNNQSPQITGRAKEEFLLSQDIGVLRELTLDYQHNNFSIGYSAMQMTTPDKIRYRHKLEGYDKNWIETDSENRTATYTDLDAGEYMLRVRASNHQGIWSDQEKTLVIVILPPPWKTWWAYCLYGAAILGIILTWRQYEISRLRLKQRATQLAEIDQLKSRFFANISHEFRTPVTLLLSPLKALRKSNSNPDEKTMIDTMIKNGKGLLRLINQLLDLSKIEAGRMQLHASPVDFVELLKEHFSAYESLAKEREIEYIFLSDVKDLVIYADEEKIERVIHNILSNAFKFTQEKARIIVRLSAETKSAVFTVSDTGIGIPPDQIDKVFDRFYQVDSSQTRPYEGSGLGMALAKELVELHHGAISVRSTLHKGTEFIVRLPLGKEHFRKEEIALHKKSGKRDFANAPAVNTVTIVEPVDEQPMPAESPVVLVVEDNDDMRHYIRKTLSPNYQIEEAGNGKEALKIATETLPDLIISDVMMPGMDGYMLCSKMKTNVITSHIPVILLTAKADRESKLAGLELGADDYLSKPFDADELKLVVRNRIKARLEMREHFSKEITLKPNEITVTSLDEKFLTNLLQIIEAHMDDEDFSIEDFSQESGCSRMQFYRKIKGLTGQTPSQFVRSIRLKRAAQLLAGKSDNISQIAYSVGFSSVAYFNKCFKEQFEMTPSQFGQVKKEAAKA